MEKKVKDKGDASVAEKQVSEAGSQASVVSKQTSETRSQTTVRDVDNTGLANVVKERATSVVDGSGGQTVPEPKTKGEQPSVATAKGDVITSISGGPLPPAAMVKEDVITSTKGSRPPAAGEKGGSTDKVATVRSISNENGGKTSTGPSKDGSNRAIVEVLDRVDTPQFTTSAMVNGDGNGGRNISVVGGRNVRSGSRNAAVNGVSEAVAFSVLPDGERNDERPCECPECRKKPRRSSSSKHCNTWLLLILFKSY